MKVFLAQMKPVLGDIEKNALKHYEQIEKAVETGCDVIVFPELSLTGYYLLDLYYDVAITEEHEIYKKLLEYSNKISIVFGFVYESPESLFYNASAFLEDGKTLDLHKKVYLPDYTMFEEARYFASGNEFAVFDSKLGKCGMLICEDALHQSSTYILSQSGVQNIFVISNSPARGVIGDEHSAEETWRMANRYSANLLTVNLVFVNRVGVEDGVVFWGGSEIYSALGEKVLRLPNFEEAGKCAEISNDALRRARIHNPFFRDEKAHIVRNFLNRKEAN